MHYKQVSEFWTWFYELYSALFDVRNRIRDVIYFGAFDELNACLVVATFGQDLV